jgi:hypothetical protein
VTQQIRFFESNACRTPRMSWTVVQCFCWKFAW